MKQFFTLFLAFLSLNFLNAQIVTFDFAGIAGNEASVISNFNNSFVSSSTITRGSGVSAAANADRFNATGWVTNVSPDLNDYFEFTVSPSSGCNISITSITMQHQRSGTGPIAFAIRSSLDSYAANLSTGTIGDVTTTQNTNFDIDDLTFANLTAAVTFRIYAFSAEQAGGSWGIGDGSGNDLIINGTGSCSSCDLVNAGLILGTCNDAGTTNNSADDFYSISINPTGTNLSSTYTVSGDFTLGATNYGTATLLSSNVLIAGGSKSFTITDASGTSCQLVVNVNPPPTCSPDEITLNSLTLQAQFINPCGQDGQNEFIAFKTGSSSVNIADISFGSVDASTGTQPNFNFWWHGSNVPTEANPTFTSNTETCGGSGLTCYGFKYPSSDASLYTSQLNDLNSVAGCNVFLMPSSDQIPANANVIFFLAGGTCSFDNIVTNLNFSNHCSGSTPITQYYLVLGEGNTACGTSGYFSNSAPRTSYFYNYDGSGSYSDVANYYVDIISYTPTATAGTNAGFVNRAGEFIVDEGCVPVPKLIVFPLKLLYFNASLKGSITFIKWKTMQEQNVSHFEVQMSVDGFDFQKLVHVPASNISSKEYNQVDLSTKKDGIYYYRLKILEKDGSFTFSPVKSIFLNQSSQVRITYNIENQEIRFANYEKIKNGNVIIYDLAGKKINEFQKIDLSEPLHLSRIQNGIYICQLQTNLQNTSIKIYCQE